MDPVLAIELTFTALLVLALVAITVISVGVIVKLFKGQS